MKLSEKKNLLLINHVQFIPFKAIMKKKPI